MNKFLLFPLSVLLLLACSTFSSKRNPAVSLPFAPVEPGSLFASQEPLFIELDAPLNDLFDRVKKAEFSKKKEVSVKGMLSYTDVNSQTVVLPVDIHAKGFSTLMMCSFPKLELTILSKERAGTLFAEIKTVDLNTHCGETNSPGTSIFVEVAHYNHREALIYRMAEVLEIPTLKARPVFIRYKNSQIPAVENQEFQAFFLEDMGAFRKRLNAKEIKGTDDAFKSLALAKDPSKVSQYAFSDVASAPMVDPEDAARIALFQSMIFNGDWFIKMNPQHFRSIDGSDKSNLWNTKIAELPNGRWVLFPQDFSLSGILKGMAANNLDKVVFESVPQATQEKLRQNFIDKKSEIYALLNTLSKDPQGPVIMKKTLDKFFAGPN